MYDTQRAVAAILCMVGMLIFFFAFSAYEHQGLHSCGMVGNQTMWCPDATATP